MDKAKLRTRSWAMLLAALAAVWACSCCRRDPGAAPEVGDVAPAFQLPSIDGETKGISDYHGRAIMVNFWTIACPHCVREMPDLERLSREAQSAVVLTINIGSTVREVEAFLGERGFEALVDTEGEVARLYGVQGVPCAFAVSPEGVIVGKRLGAMSLEEMRRFLETAAGR